MVAGNDLKWIIPSVLCCGISDMWLNAAANPLFAVLLMNENLMIMNWIAASAITITIITNFLPAGTYKLSKMFLRMYMTLLVAA